MENNAQSAAFFDALADLHRHTVDVLAGFDTTLAKAAPEFRETVQRYRTLHSRHATELARLLAEAGREPDHDGSFMGTVNRTVVSLRAAVDDIGADVLPQIHSGEKHVMDAIGQVVRAAVATPRLPWADLNVVSDMRRELASLLSETSPTTA